MECVLLKFDKSKTSEGLSRKVSLTDSEITMELDNTLVANTSTEIPDLEDLRNNYPVDLKADINHNGILGPLIATTKLQLMQPIPKVPAVTMRNANKRYGNNKPLILNNFCMTVQQGTIYSLLGPSGCGKTSVLSCVVGIRHLKSGQVLVFGSKPGSKGSGIPGKLIGYMPQDLALYNDVSIQEILTYFGILYGMTLEEIRSQQKFLIKMLGLPEPSTRVGTLSGGQKRRVSLALALLHSPKLLILDEPTVGVDPLLRESIWAHLRDLVANSKISVLITTHFVCEAEQSHTIGFMREGRLLVEGDPKILIKASNARNLEEIVIKLCKLDDLSIVKAAQEALVHNSSFIKPGKVEPSTLEITQTLQNPNKKVSVTRTKYESLVHYWRTENPANIQNSMTRIRALAMKNIVVMMRNFILFLFLLIVPSFQIIVLCLAIGSDPKPMHIAVVNHEINDSLACWTTKRTSLDGECDVENLSCRYLAKLPADVIVLSDYESESAAQEAIREGKVWGFISFPAQYSDDLYSRNWNGHSVDNETLEGSLIQLKLDMSNKQIGVTLKKIFYETYMDFAKEMLSGCGLNPALGELPVKFLKPEYGTDDTDFRDFVAPSVLLSAAFFFPLCSSSISYIWEKKQGTLQRAMVAGVQTWEIMAAFFLTEGVLLFIQLGLSFGIMTVVFGIVIHGSVILALSLAVLVGLGGVSMGMPIALQYISYALPSALSSNSIRSIVNRGWGLDHIKVWPGFMSTALWICFYWTLTIYIHKAKGSRK